MSAHSLFLLLNLAWAGCEASLALRRRARDGGRHDAGTLGLLWTMVCAATGIAVVAAMSGVGQLPPSAQAPLRWSGCALIVGGLALRIWAIQVLGRWFTVDVTVQAGHALIERGPYRLVRHPSYSGALLAFAGLALGLGNAVAMLAIVPAVGWAFRRRIEVEDAALHAAFGHRYLDYAAGRARLVPGLW